MKISRRKLTYAEAKTIAQDIKLTPNIIGYLPGELMRLRNVLVAENNGELAGVLAYVETDKFVDLKLLIVREKFRHQGYGTELSKRGLDLFKDARKPLYAVTKNEVVIKQLERAGFVRVGFTGLPVVCMLHQSKMFFSLYRLKEYVRKAVRFPHSGRFSYWLKAPVKS